jgi:hypothetical protein
MSDLALGYSFSEFFFLKNGFPTESRQKEITTSSLEHGTSLVEG